MKTPSPSNKRGIALIIVMAILVAVTLLVAALLQLSLFNERETIRQLRQAQAHWLAEAGLERVISMIKVSETYRDSLGSLNNLPVTSADDDPLLNGTGSYIVTLLKTDGPGPEESTFDIESTGFVSNAAMSAAASVRVKYVGAPGMDQALVALGGHSEIKNPSVTIYGDVYIAGTGTVGTQIDGNLEDADDGAGISYGGTLLPVDTLPRIPIDRAPYETLITYAQNPTNSGVLPGGEVAVSLSNSTNYYHGDITVVSISGTGTIVASGDIQIGKKAGGSMVAIPSGMQLVSGNNARLTKALAQTNNSLYAPENITIESSSEFNGEGITLLAMQGIYCEASAPYFAGIMYAEGLYSGDPKTSPPQSAKNYSIIFKDGNQGDNYRGTIIAWNGFDIGARLTFTYDPSVFADPNPLSDYFNGFVPTRPLQWEQTPYQTP
jgi:hypothetical protein